MPEQQDWHPEAFSLVAQMVNNPPATQETWVWALGWEDPLEEGMATHSSILVWRIPWTEDPMGYSPWGHKESDTTERLSTSTQYKGYLTIDIFSKELLLFSLCALDSIGINT